jgi:flagellar L-ring protein precursor FlgH
MNAIKLITLLLAILLLVGCQSAPQRDPEFAAVTAPMPPAPPRGNGAIFQAGHETSWFENNTARRVGDLLTVRLVEETDASSTNSSTVSKSTSSSISTPTILGAQPSFNLPYDNSSNPLRWNAALESDHSFSGDGDLEQSNELTGSISVMVTEVLPNGYLRIRGEKRIGMNAGNEYVRLSGIVRPTDIDRNNTVASTQVADTTLIYKGDGQVASASMMGWLSKFFISSLMPF